MLVNILFFVSCFFIITAIAEIVGHFKANRGILPDGSIMVGHKQHVTNVKGRKIGRNELCPCGSGNKSKKCCKLTHLYKNNYSYE